MKVKVTIEETVVETFEIEVDDCPDGIGEAIEKGIGLYWGGELVLAPGEVQFRQINATSIDDTISTEWVEF